MEILLVITVGTLCIACFLIGVKVGQAVSKGKEIELPSLDPFKAYKEHQDRKEAEKEQSRQNILMENIEKYDGTSNGQKDIPE